MEFPDLVESLRDAQGVFAIGTLGFDEWFDPAVQVYLSTIYERRVDNAAFKYERVLFLPGPAAEGALGMDFLDGYHAHCLAEIHRHLKIQLYKVFAPDIRQLLARLDSETLAGIGFLPAWALKGPKLLRTILIAVSWRHRVRRVAALIVMKATGNTAVVFSKTKRIVSVNEHAQSEPYSKLVTEVRKQISQPGTNIVHDRYFLK